MKRAVDIGPLDAAAIRTRGGKVRLRLHFSVEQLEAMLRAAMEADDADEEAVEANLEEVKRSVTQCNANSAQRREEQTRQIQDGGDARASPPVFVIEGTRAWDEWVAEKKRQTGRKFDLTTTAQVDGKTRRGWYFPSLFPPKVGADPPPLKDDDSNEAQNL